MQSIFAFIPLQQAPMLSSWLTPVWILSLGILIGLAAAAVIYLVLGVISRIGPLGAIADNRQSATVVSLLIAAIVAGAGIYKWVVMATVPEGLPPAELAAASHQGYLILPLICLGLIVGFGVVYGMWRRTAGELIQIAREGVMGYLLLALAIFMVMGLATTMLIEDRQKIIDSLPLVLKSDRVDYQFSLDGAELGDGGQIAQDQAPFQRRELQYDAEKASEVVIKSDRTILIADGERADQFSMSPVRIEADQPVVWRQESSNLMATSVIPLPIDPSRGVYFQNREIDPASVQISIITRPPAPEAITVWGTAAIVCLLIVTLVTIRQAAPQIAAIALATAKSELAQPLYGTLVVLAGTAIVLFTWVPFHTLGEDIKVLKDSGMTLIMVFSIIQAVWASGTSVSEEIEGRTALTVLSKPVGRRSFLLGKYLGIMWTVLLMFLLLGLLLMVVTAYKPIYDARENSSEAPGWQHCHQEMVSTTPGLTLLFMETTLIAGISVAIATRLPVIANFVICFTIYVIGNITAPIVRASADNNELVKFVGQLIAVIFPNLNAFNLQAAVDAGNPIAPIYLAATFNYLACFAIVILAASMLLFEDRDLA